MKLFILLSILVVASGTSVTAQTIVPVPEIPERVTSTDTYLLGARVMSGTVGDVSTVKGRSVSYGH
jgi:hypothetical protein